MIIKKSIKFIGLSIVSLMLFSCSPKEKLIHQQNFVFGTLVDITISSNSEEKAQQAIQAVFKQFDELHRELHAWNQTSELSKMNQAIENHQTELTVTPHIADLIEISKIYEQKSNGLFNPSIGHLIQVWGFQNDQFKAELPNPDMIRYWQNQRPSFNQVHLIQNKSKIKVMNSSIRFDFGGIAKGYALDLASKILKQHEIQNALINIGGNIFAMGKKGNLPWQVGLQHPRKSEILGIMTLEDGEAIGTSGDYQRYFEIKNQRFCHIIDPRTGYPANKMQSVTVLIRPKEFQKNTGILSDILSKPLFINPDLYQNDEDMIAKMGIHGVIMIHQNGEIYLNQNIKKRFRLNQN